VILTGLACSEPELPEISNAMQVMTLCAGEAENRYFPGGMFRSVPANLPVGWAHEPAQILEAMHEPPLSCGAEADSYRILWVHSFSRWPPTMVRMRRRGDTWDMTAVQLAGLVDRKVVARHERALSDGESREMLAAVSGFGLWNRNDFAWDRDVDDGAMWIIEGRRGTGYHPVVLINADRKAVQKLAVVFFQTAGINPIVLTEGPG
jgi:hypothetical protein